MSIVLCFFSWRNKMKVYVFFDIISLSEAWSAAKELFVLSNTIFDPFTSTQITVPASLS